MDIPKDCQSSQSRTRFVTSSMEGRDRAVSQNLKILACCQVKLDSLLSCSIPEFIKLWTPLMPSRLRLTKPLWAPVIDKLSSTLLPQQVPKLIATNSAWQLLTM